MMIYRLWPILLGWAVLIGGDENDALAPKSKAEDALALQLHTATILTADLNPSLLFYRDGLGMRVRGPIELADEARAIQRRLWGMPDDIGWRLYLLDRPGAPGSAQIRLLVLDRPTPAIHRSWDALTLGPFSLGFPNTDQVALDERMRRLGFGALNELERYQVPRPDGSRYTIDETIFNGPDFVHAVGIQRKDGMAPVGPVDPATGRGGPAYSAQVVADSDAVLAFYTEVLGMEIRFDREWKSAGTKGALRIPDGSVFRFTGVYAKGARSGHLLFVHYRNRTPRDAGVPPRPPHRGLVMWSFPVRDLAEIQARARKAGVAIVGEPVVYQSPALGRGRVMTALAPNGFLVELFQPRE